MGLPLAARLGDGRAGEAHGYMQVQPPARASVLLGVSAVSAVGSGDKVTRVRQVPLPVVEVMLVVVTG